MWPGLRDELERVRASGGGDLVAAWSLRHGVAAAAAARAGGPANWRAPEEPPGRWRASSRAGVRCHGMLPARCMTARPGGFLAGMRLAVATDSGLLRWVAPLWAAVLVGAAADGRRVAAGQLPSEVSRAIGPWLGRVATGPILAVDFTGAGFEAAMATPTRAVVCAALTNAWASIWGWELATISGVEGGIHAQSRPVPELEALASWWVRLHLLQPEV